MNISRRTIERDLDRGVKFLGTLSREPHIFNILATEAGYSPGAHQRGWELHMRVQGHAASAGPNPEIDPARSGKGQAEAIAKLDQWDGPAFNRTRATLRYSYPHQLAYIFDGLRAGRSSEAVATVNTYLERVAALKDGTDPAREASRTQDREAALRLEERMIVPPHKVAELREWIRMATVEVPSTIPPVAPDPYGDETFLALAFEYHVWLIDWRGQAREVITRGDYRRRLGLVSETGSGADEPNLLALITQKLTVKFGSLPDAARSRLDEATPEELEDIAERLVMATSIEEALGQAAS